MQVIVFCTLPRSSGRFLCFLCLQMSSVIYLFISYRLESTWTTDGHLLFYRCPFFPPLRNRFHMLLPNNRTMQYFSQVQGLINDLLNVSGWGLGLHFQPSPCFRWQYICSRARKMELSTSMGAQLLRVLCDITLCASWVLRMSGPPGRLQKNLAFAVCIFVKGPLVFGFASCKFLCTPFPRLSVLVTGLLPSICAAVPNCSVLRVGGCGNGRPCLLLFPHKAVVLSISNLGVFMVLSTVPG